MIRNTLNHGNLIKRVTKEKIEEDNYKGKLRLEVRIGLCRTLTMREEMWATN